MVSPIQYSNGRTLTSGQNEKKKKKKWAVSLTSLFPIGNYKTMATSRVQTNRQLWDDG